MEQHFEAEVLRHEFSVAHGHYRLQVGVFTSIEQLRSRLQLAPGETLNQCVYEVIPRDRFEIKQGETVLLNWTSEDADGGTNRVIFNNLTGLNFTGTEYEVYLAQMREKTDFDIQPELLTLDRIECQMPEILDAASIGWLDALAEPLAVAPGIFRRNGARHLFFRFERENNHYIFFNWNDVIRFEKENAKPETCIEISRELDAEMQNGFDCWLVRKLEEFFE